MFEDVQTPINTEVKGLEEYNEKSDKDTDTADSLADSHAILADKEIEIHID